MLTPALRIAARPPAGDERVALKPDLLDAAIAYLQTVPIPTLDDSRVRCSITARSIPRFLLRVLLGVALPWLASVAMAQAPALAPAATGPLYAVEFKVGPRWVAGKPPAEQEQFREHSANLRKLRDQGSLVIGARYGDKGFILLAAETEAAARALIDADPAVQHGTFVYELNEFSVFYGGAVQPRPRPPR